MFPGKSPLPPEEGRDSKDTYVLITDTILGTDLHGDNLLNRVHMCLLETSEQKIINKTFDLVRLFCLWTTILTSYLNVRESVSLDVVYVGEVLGPSPSLGEDHYLPKPSNKRSSFPVVTP